MRGYYLSLACFRRAGPPNRSQERHTVALALCPSPPCQFRQVHMFMLVGAVTVPAVTDLDLIPSPSPYCYPIS